MKIRNKKTWTEATTGNFNTSALWEIIIYYEDGCDSDYPSNWDVFIANSGQWMDMNEAFKVNAIIPDNYNTQFREPANDEERKRGWYY